MSQFASLEPAARPSNATFVWDGLGHCQCLNNCARQLFDRHQNLWRDWRTCCFPACLRALARCWLNDLAPAVGHIFLGGLWEHVSACQCQNRPTRKDRVHTQETGRTARLNCVTHPAATRALGLAATVKVSMSAVSALWSSRTVSLHGISSCTLTSILGTTCLPLFGRTNGSSSDASTDTKSRSRSSNNVGSGPLGWLALGPGCAPRRCEHRAAHIKASNRTVGHHGWQNCSKYFSLPLLCSRPRLASQPPMPRGDRLDVLQSTPAFLPCNWE